MAEEAKDPKKLFNMYVAHVGINASNDEEVESIVSEFQTLMGLKRNEVTPASLFADHFIEVMRPGRGRGEKGHIGFHVDNVDEAEKWFEKRGFEINEDSRVKNPDGSTFLVYFKHEIAGFAIHLTVQK
ncbi:MAG: VOC family protein [Coriobacteriaceae bacterium]